MSSGVYLGGSRNDWETPPDLFDACNKQFGPLTLDVCATGDNTKCTAFLHSGVDGLAQGWEDGWWCNPPYLNFARQPVIQDWVAKAVAESQAGRSGVMLLVNDPSTQWFANVAKNAETIAFLTGPRIRFLDPSGEGRIAPTITNLVAHFTPRGSSHQRVCLWDWRNAPLSLSEEDFEVSLGRIARLTQTNEALYERLTLARKENQQLRRSMMRQKGTNDANDDV